MKNNRKHKNRIVLAVLCLVLALVLAGMSMGRTSAVLTASSGEVENNFTADPNDFTNRELTSETPNTKTTATNPSETTGTTSGKTSTTGQSTSEHETISAFETTKASTTAKHFRNKSKTAPPTGNTQVLLPCAAIASSAVLITRLIKKLQN